MLLLSRYLLSEQQKSNWNNMHRTGSQEPDWPWVLGTVL